MGNLVQIVIKLWEKKLFKFGKVILKNSSTNLKKMPRGKELSDYEKGQISAFYSSGCGFREIGRKIGRSHKVVSNFLKDQENYGKNKRTGRKHKLSNRDKRRIINHASNSTMSCKALGALTETNVSVTTVWRVLKGSEHIVRSKLQTAPRLLQRHIAARMLFAENNMNTDWPLVSTYTLASYTDSGKNET